MTEPYLKMVDAFPVLISVDELSATFVHPKAKYAAHAINSHDELVAEVERLRGELSSAASVLDEVDRVISERIKNGAYDLDDISAEVSQAIERIEFA